MTEEKLSYAEFDELMIRISIGISKYNKRVIINGRPPAVRTDEIDNPQELLRCLARALSPEAVKFHKHLPDNMRSQLVSAFLFFTAVTEGEEPLRRAPKVANSDYESIVQGETGL